MSPGPRIILHPLQPFLCPDSAFMASFLTAIRPGFTTPHGNGGRHIVRTRLPSLDTTDHPINRRGIKTRIHIATLGTTSIVRCLNCPSWTPQAGRSGQFDKTGGQIRLPHPIDPPSSPPRLDGPHLPASFSGHYNRHICHRVRFPQFDFGSFCPGSGQSQFSLQEET